MLIRSGTNELFAQYARGDRHARGDLIVLADKLGVDLTAGQTKAIEEALAPNYATILATYVQRQNEKVFTGSPVFAPPELLDDDPQNKD